MKLLRFFIKSFAILLLAGCAKDFNDTSIKERVDALEEQVQENTNSLRKLSSKLEDVQKKGLTVSVTSVSGGKTLTFSDGTVLTVQDGAQGSQGAQGNPGDDGSDSVVTITESSDGLYYVINVGGKGYTVKKSQSFSLKLEDAELSIAPGESKEISYTLTDADASTVVFVSASSGYTAEVDMTDSKVIVTASAELPEDGFVIITARKESTGEESSQYIGPVQDTLPVVRIAVENGADIVSKDNYLNMSLSITDDGESILGETGRIKGRGNATWINYPKKPYKVKFDSKQGIFGFPENKDWVFLAEYCDRSLLRTVYLQELAKALDMPYPFHYQHVHLYLNDEYRGIYLVTDQVEKKSNRVDISDDGFLFENDGRYSWEPLWFRTTRKGYYYTFKYPDPEDGEIAEGDENFNFITGLVNSFESALYGNDFKDPDEGYRKYIDPQSFARWYLAMELMANYDPNFYYVLPSRQEKILAGPVWDAEWSLGLTYKASETADWAKSPAQPDSEQAIWSEWKYYGRLFEDPYFVGVVKEEWAKLKPQLDTFRAKIASVAASISIEQVQNFERWDILDTFVSVELVCTGSWEAEVAYIADFFNKRVQFVDDTLNQMTAE